MLENQPVGRFDAFEMQQEFGKGIVSKDLATYLEAVSLRIVVVGFGLREKIVVVMKTKVPLVIRDGSENDRGVDALSMGHEWPKYWKQENQKQGSHGVTTPQ